MIQLGNVARDSAIIEALEGVLMYVGGGCVSVECGRKMHRNGTFIILLFRQIIMGSVKLIRLWDIMILELLMKPVALERRSLKRGGAP